MSFSQRLRWTAKSPASLIIASLRAFAVAGKLRSSVMCHFCLACRWATVEAEVTALRCRPCRLPAMARWGCCDQVCTGGVGLGVTRTFSVNLLHPLPIVMDARLARFAPQRTPGSRLPSASNATSGEQPALLGLCLPAPAAIFNCAAPL